MMKIDAPKMTVVTSVKNLIKENRQEVFIQSLDSVHEQTYSNIQHIIVDGGSSDGTIQFLKQLSPAYNFEFHVIQDHNLWEGLYNGLTFAKGKFINFMNSDDYFSSPDAVQLAVNALESKGAKWFFSESTVLREDGTSYKFPTSVAGVFNCLGIVHQTMWVDVQLLHQIDPFRKNHITRENYLMMILILNKYPFVYSKRSLVVYREGGFSGKTYGGKNLYRTKADCGEYFYRLAGKLWGLSKSECDAMFGWNSFSELGVLPNLRIVGKLGFCFLKYDYLKRYFLHVLRHKNKKELFKNFLKLVFSLRVSVKLYRR